MCTRRKEQAKASGKPLSPGFGKLLDAPWVSARLTALNLGGETVFTTDIGLASVDLYGPYRVKYGASGRSDELKNAVLGDRILDIAEAKLGRMRAVVGFFQFCVRGGSWEFGLDVV